MRVGEIFDMDIVAHTRSIWCRIVSAEDSDIGAFAGGRFTGHFDKQRCLTSRLANPALRITTRDIEVTQRDMAHRSCRAHIVEHSLAHQLRSAIRVDRIGRRLFIARPASRYAVARRGEKKNEALPARRYTALDKVACAA